MGLIHIREKKIVHIMDWRGLRNEIHALILQGKFWIKLVKLSFLETSLVLDHRRPLVHVGHIVGNKSRQDHKAIGCNLVNISVEGVMGPNGT